MVFLAPFIGTLAILSGLVSAVPRPDSAIGDEVAVSAPNGVVMSDTSKLPMQTASSSPTGSSWSGSYGSPSDNSGSSHKWGSSYGNGGSYGASDSSVWASSATATTSTSTTAAMSYSTPSYGSGNSNWGGSGYDSCVQQCVASFGTPPATYTAPTSTSTGTSGGGATHTVIVAPTQGVLRYVPFITNASVGDVVRFMWGANEHTVTKSSALTPCNKTADAPFASGEQNKSFVFDQVINSTETTFYYCGTPTHCQKGMFGIINPPSTTGAMSMGNMMASMAANDSNMAAMWSYTNNQTSGKSVASSWGSNLDMSGMPTWSYPFVAQNMMYNRLFISSNDDAVTPDGTFELSAAGSSPLMVPQDITSVLAAAATTTSASGYSPASTPSIPGTSSSAATSPVSASSKSNSASSLGSPSVLIVLVTVIATFFAL